MEQVLELVLELACGVIRVWKGDMEPVLDLFLELVLEDIQWAPVTVPGQYEVLSVSSGHLRLDRVGGDIFQIAINCF